jgi:hypothetical protein
VLQYNAPYDDFNKGSEFGSFITGSAASADPGYHKAAAYRIPLKNDVI